MSSGLRVIRRPAIGPRGAGTSDAAFPKQRLARQTFESNNCRGRKPQRRPDALLVTHAKPVLTWLRALGRQVPRDVGVVELELHPEPGSAGTLYEPARIGALAVNTLVGLMHRNEKGVPPSQTEILLSGTWHEGRTLPPRR